MDDRKWFVVARESSQWCKRREKLKPNTAVDVRDVVGIERVFDGKVH